MNGGGVDHKQGDGAKLIAAKVIPDRILIDPLVSSNACQINDVAIMLCLPTKSSSAKT